MNDLEEKFIKIALETKEQRDAEGKVRWLYMMNWIANALYYNNDEFDVHEFYNRINK